MSKKNQENLEEKLYTSIQKSWSRMEKKCIKSSHNAHINKTQWKLLVTPSINKSLKLTFRKHLGEPHLAMLSPLGTSKHFLVSVSGSLVSIESRASPIKVGSTTSSMYYTEFWLDPRLSESEPALINRMPRWFLHILGSEKCSSSAGRLKSDYTLEFWGEL